MTVRFVQEGRRIDYTPGVDLNAGHVVVADGLMLITALDIATGVLGAAAVEGVFDFPKTTGVGTALSLGQTLYWNATSGVATAEHAGGTRPAIGPCVAAAADGDAVVRAKLIQRAPVPPAVIADPGDAGALPVAGSGVVGLVSADAETRTLADPSFAGQELTLAFKTDGGDVVVTAATAVNQTGNNTVTFADAGDAVVLQAVPLGDGLVWRVVVNDGAAL